MSIRAEITPTAPPEKDATIGSTWLEEWNFLKEQTSTDFKTF